MGSTMSPWRCWWLEQSSATCPVAADQGSLAMVVTMLGPALVSAVGLLTILLLSVGVHGAREVHPIPTLLLTWAFLERNSKRGLCRSQESLVQVPQPHWCWQLGLRSPEARLHRCSLESETGLKPDL